MDFNPQTPNPELKTISQRKFLLNEFLLRLAGTEPRKSLFRGDGVGRLSSYVAGWMASREIEVILLDGANRFDPYAVSLFARSISIPPEKLLKKIRIARAFTCYQMAALMGEKLSLLLKEVNSPLFRKKTWILFLGPLSTFLDEDVPEREVRPLFERALKSVEGVAAEGIPLLIFQAPIHARSKRSYLMRRLFHFSDWAWKIESDDQGPKMLFEKGPSDFQIADFRLQIAD
jgi:hypothetical protein